MTMEALLFSTPYIAFQHSLVFISFMFLQAIGAISVFLHALINALESKTDRVPINRELKNVKFKHM